MHTAATSQAENIKATCRQESMVVRIPVTIPGAPAS
jgi:hypothetical protein